MNNQIVMTFNDFIILDDHSKEETVRKANCIGDHHKGNNRISIYDLGDFFVEVLFNIRDKKISRFRFFRSDLQIDYIGQIDVRK
ncbi:MAG TPA: hypothetical protein DIT07_09490 [Sphingobacteriaceae bacterium]|nr:hypothetical protein [Sphingobacteriaceae bacterium]